MVASPETLVARARARTGLADLGPDGWQEGLARLVDAVGTDVGDDRAAVDGIEELIVQRLVTRLRVEDWHAAHGHEAARPVEGPLVIVGLPRTATTALHHLLSLDPRFRYLRRWELKDPVPPPDAATEADDPRRPGEPPAADVRHITAVDGPAEDGDIHTLQFRHGEISLPVPTYTRWWIGADHSGAFAYHERFLRMLHAHRPPTRWLLKFPAYLFQLRELAAWYPDAQFVVTHRDPLAVVPSTCSVVFDARRRRVPGWTPEPAAFGREVLDYLLAALEHATAGRRALGQDRFLDVGQHEIEDDALAVAERVYAFAGLDLTDDVRAAMARWAGENRRGSRGAHHYRADDYGLSEDRIEDAFAGYIAEYGELCRPHA
ncbi:MAG TPA: sulfotransferase [Acidimicrobiales bacterium]|nr:sulfotransferase [Acidimicrobiales bacterium]